ncbi:MAG TPA: alpha-lytic protease prodomain-containing protein [Pilimelia sp.]|nr:alpha-lytic protease prodomain-containing protein [Pilimelia sp.]
MQRKHALAACVAATALGLAAAVTAPALAEPERAAPAPAAGAGLAADLPAGLLKAVQRDLNLTAEQALARLAQEDRAARDQAALRKRLGARYGGAWVRNGTLVVGVTDPAQAAQVRAAGAEPQVVARSQEQLEAAVARLDAAAAKAPKTVPGWYVDSTSNSVVVLSRASGVGAARAFVRSAGVDAAAVRIQESTEAPRPLIDVIGGNAYHIGTGSRCSVGFSVTNGGFVTAGHCGRTGASTSNPSGSFAGSSFPGNDYAWVRVSAGNTMRPLVNNYSGGTVTVAGSTQAAVGATVCRSGSTTGWRCGTIQAFNQSVTYPEGTVSGLIRTTVCAEPGDSGGSLVAGNQAQGVTSGGSGNCRTGGTTYFQPVNEILQVYNLTLMTGTGGTPPPPGSTPPPGTGCSSHANRFSGSLSAGGQAIQPNNSYFQTTGSGTHSACLTGPTGADFDLYLQKWNGSAWANVASGTSPGANETLTYNGTAGYYRYRVHAYSGSGSYTLGYTRPA